MDNIHQHIKDLLAENDCVIIPNFGAFIADYNAAKISDEGSTIPSKDILFNRKLTRNDGLLINAILEQDNLTYTEANIQIEIFVKQCNEQLLRGESVTFEGIGVLKQDEIGFWHFEADKNNDLLRTAYGLTPIILQKIKMKGNTKIKTPETKNRTLLRVASTVAAVIIMIILATPVSDQPTTQHSGFLTRMETDNTLSAHNAEIPETTEQTEEYSKVSANTKTQITDSENDVKIVEETITRSTKTFNIIVASLANEAAATKYSKLIKTNYQFDDITVLKNNGRYRVCVASFKTEDEASAFVKSIRPRNSDLKDAWVLALQEE